MIQTIVEDALIAMGGTPNLKGFGYIVDAIEVITAKPNAVIELTKSIYPAVAEKNGVTSSRVERAIRHCVEKIYLNSNLSAIEETIGNIADPNKGKPTNGAFLFTLALIVKRKMKDENSI